MINALGVNACHSQGVAKIGAQGYIDISSDDAGIDIYPKSDVINKNTICVDLDIPLSYV